MAGNYGFIGPSAEQESLALDLQRSVNLYAEGVESGTGKAPKALIGIPGLSAFCTLPSAPVRATLRHEGRAFAVGGDILYELLTGGSFIARAGGLINDGLPASIHANGYGGQLWVVSGGCGGIYTLATNAWTPNVRTDVIRGGFCDGYFLSLTAMSLYSSDLENGLVWNALAYEPRRTGADAWIGMATVERMIWLVGSQTSSVFYNAGTSPFPFAEFQGGFLEQGTAAAHSLALCDNSLMWLGKSHDGPATVWRSVGFKAQRISTHPVEQAISRYTTITDCVAWAYTMKGHAFCVFVFPSAGACWTYDATTGQWHERVYWNTSTGLEELYKPRFHCYGFGKHLVGDGVTGAIYHLDPNTYTDAGGTPLARMRVGPYATAEQKRLFHRSFWLDIETGAVSPETWDERYRADVWMDRPAGWWKLNETTGSAADSSGAGLTVAATVAPTYAEAGVRPGSLAMLFDGTDDYLSATITAPIIGGTNWADDASVEFWARATAQGGPVCAQSLSTSDNGYFQTYQFTSGYVVSITNDAGTNHYIEETAGTDRADSVWHHVVWTKAGTAWTLYVDGAVVAQKTVTIAGTWTTPNRWAIGTRMRSTGGHSDHPTATIQDVAVYTSALSAARVLAHYQSGAAIERTAVVMLSKTDDKGKTWQSLGDKTLGAQGETNARVEWKRLGSAKQRAYRVVITDPVPVRIADAYLEADPGGGQ